MNQDNIRDQKRRIAAKEIMLRFDRITEIWGILDHYEKEKQLPGATDEPVKRRINEMDRPELISFCMNIYPTISRLKQRVKAEKDPIKLEKYKQELQLRNEELQELIAIRDQAVNE